MTIRKIRMPALKQLLRGSVALGLVLGAPLILPGSVGPLATAYAQGHGSSGQGMGGHRGGASGGGATTGGATGGQGMGQGGQGAERGHYGQSGATGESTEEGTSEDQKGPRFGGGENARQPESGTRGGRPAWAKEGIPEVELGRLSVARAPAHVLEHAFSEVISNWSTLGTTVLVLSAPDQPTLTMTVAELYSKSALEFASIVQTYYASVLRIDSPLENLALLKDLATNGTTALTGVTPSSTLSLEAIFLGSASDKTLPITADTVIAMNTILGLPTLTDTQVADLAAQAEAVRLAILSGHG